MSRIDELIAKHCPDGVEFRRLGECVVKNTGGGTPSRSIPSYWDGDIPWASVGDLSVPGNFILTTRASITSKGLKSSPSNIISRGDVIVAVKISPGKMKIAAKDIAINQDLRGLSLHNFINSSFLTYYFQTISIVGNGTIVKGITTDTLERIRVPIPPLEVQREIVKVLDTFTKLEAELEAELEARRRQYQYYRNALLTFGERTNADASKHASKQARIRWATLGEIAINLDSQRRPVTKSAREAGEFPYYGASGIVDYVSDYIFDGDYLLVSEDGANLLARSTPIAFSISGKTWVNNHAHVLQFNSYAERRFVEIYLNSIDLSPYVSGAAQPKLNQANLNRIPIPVPSFEEQERIVAILDKFDELVNDLSSGLPAEIKARRQQYEYYRDRLLTFRETA